MPFGYQDQKIGLAIIKIQILAFFQANPHARDNLNGFSRRLFIEPRLIDEAMEELIDVGIIEKGGRYDMSIYRLKVSYATLEEYLA